MLDLWTKHTTRKCTKCRKHSCKSPENIVYNHYNSCVRSRHMSGSRSRAVHDLTVYTSDQDWFLREISSDEPISHSFSQSSDNSGIPDMDHIRNWDWNEERKVKYGSHLKQLSVSFSKGFPWFLILLGEGLSFLDLKHQISQNSGLSSKIGCPDISTSALSLFQLF